VNGPFLALAPVRQPSGKIITAWAVEGDLDPTRLRSNRFSLEWPPKSGVMQSFPEVDRGAWFSLVHARGKLLPGQRPLLRGLTEL
jgi:predicted NUDIX family NTP pyrophosphohydrolase